MLLVQRHSLALIAVLVLAAAMRLIGLGEVPPGIHHDEASNGYDGYCVLKTGADRWGVSWPVVLEGFGRADYRGALYAYLTVPFHALMGAERLIVSTRLPAALVGMLTVVCLYVLVRRTHDRGTGLWASLLLALSPWHVQLSRFGHEASLTPAFVVLAMTLMAYGSRPSGGRRVDDSPGRLRPTYLVGAGVVLALSVYAYASMKLFVPLLLIAGAWVYRRSIAQAWRSRANRITILAALATAAVVLSPMAWLTMTEWDQVNARAEQVSLFHQPDFTIGQAFTQTAKQYLAHFAPKWLIFEGDSYIVQSPPPGFGQLNLVVFPFLLVGLYLVFANRKQNRCNYLLLAWLVLYPAAAAPTLSGPHALRSACGLPVFQWIAAIGLQSVVNWSGRSASRRIIVATFCAAAVAVNGAMFVHGHFFGWAKDPRVIMLYQNDLRRAITAVRPMVHEYDRVFISDRNDARRYWYSGEAYAIVSLTLPVDPAAFQGYDRSIDYVRPADGFHRVESFGPFVMTTRTDILRRAFEAEGVSKALIIARPGEITGGRRIRTISGPDGGVRFEIISVGN